MTDPSWALLVLALVAVLGLSGLVGWLVVTEPAAAVRRWGRADTPPSPGVREGSAPAVEDRDQVPATERRAAVIVNPTKFDDVSRVRRRVEEACQRHGWAEPLWLETTMEDPGLGQARRAVAEGVDVVCSLGGDGTVRTVASALIGTDVPLGLLPGGTGNLLARNLGIPIDSIDSALSTALTGRSEAIDTCTLTLLRPTTAELAERLEDEDDPSESIEFDEAVDDRSSAEATEEHRFLVMAGLGFDAEVMAGAPEALKAKVGWAAYIVSGLRHLKGPQFLVDVTTAEGLDLHRRVRSVVVGNVGRLTGGMILLPDAKHDDGIMDMLLLSPEGLVGWAAASVQILTRQRKGHHRVDYHTCTKVRVQSDKPVEIQLDGDTLGTASAMDITVNPLSLLVQLPR